jgi:hypothetical protein
MYYLYYITYKECKLKAFIILLALFLLPSETFAETNKSPILLEPMDVDGLVDEELTAIERDLETIKFYNKNGTKKVDKLNKYQQHFQELIPKQIELTKGRRKIQQLIDIKTKYIDCLSKKDEEDCSDLKEEFEKFDNSVLNIPQNKTHILNREVLLEIRRCSEVTREEFPGFRAVLRVDFYLDEQGFITHAQTNKSRSVSTIDLPMFDECVLHFSKKLHYFNPTNKIAIVEQNLIFGMRN